MQLAVYICLNFSEEFESGKKPLPPKKKNNHKPKTITKHKQTTPHENQDWADILK